MVEQLVEYGVLGAVLLACVAYMVTKVRRKIGAFGSTGCGGGCCCGDPQTKTGMAAGSSCGPAGKGPRKIDFGLGGRSPQE